MNTLTDTLQITKFLASKSFTQEQAEAVAEVAKQIDQTSKGQLVTKEFLRAKLQELRTEINEDMRRMEGWLVTWQISMVVALAGLLIAARLLGGV